MSVLPIFSSLPWWSPNFNEEEGYNPARSENERKDQEGVLVTQSDDEESDENGVDSSKDS